MRSQVLFSSGSANDRRQLVKEHAPQAVHDPLDDLVVRFSLEEPSPPTTAMTASTARMRTSSLSCPNRTSKTA